MLYNRRNVGFTLVELSIVIVIIGFLIAGIAAGNSLVKQAALNALVNEQKAIVTGLVNFKTVYSRLPGDIDNASAYWANCDSTPAKCDGNGKIEFIYSANFSGDAAAIESYRAMQQLSVTGMIIGNFIGVGGPTGYEGTIGLNNATI